MFPSALSVQDMAVAFIKKQMEKSFKEISHVLTSLGFVSQVINGSGSDHLGETPPINNDHSEKGNDHERLLHANTMYSLGRMFMQQNQPTEALPLIQHSLATFSNIHGPSHPRVGFALTTLASCFALNPSHKTLRKALVTLERAISIFGKAFGTECIELCEPGGPICVRAQIEEMLGKFSLAKRLWERIAAMRVTHFEPSHFSYKAARQEVQRLSVIIAKKRAPKTVQSLMRIHRERRHENAISCGECGQQLQVASSGYTSPHDNVSATTTLKRRRGGVGTLCEQCQVAHNMYRVQQSYTAREGCVSPSRVWAQNVKTLSTPLDTTCNPTAMITP
eukprot:m.113994 g.113994  ORF g.113994 m.113994 type:complete len:335 (-) comp12808_c0_seq3:110-1114(-)